MAKDHEILLCRCVAPNNELHKHDFISKRLHIKPVVYKEGCSILTPHIIIKTPTKLLQYNYLYSYDFERYYFIEDVITLPQGQVELVCKVDVLYSFRDAIMDLVVHEERATNGQSNLIVDEQVPLMHNTIVKDIINLNMHVGDEFQIPDKKELQYIITHYTSKYASVNGAEGEDGVERDNDGYLWGEMDSQGQIDAWHIADKARWYYHNYQNWNMKKSEYNQTNQRKKILSGGMYYTQALEALSGGDYPAYFNLDQTVHFTPSRYDTAYADEASAVSALRNTATFYNYNNAVPQEVKDAHAVWNGWDCSQFAWRCAFFGAGIDLTSPSNIDGRGCSSAKTATIAVSLGNYYLEKSGIRPANCLFLVENETDLLPGDIVISGNITDKAEGSYWVYANYDSSTDRMVYNYATRQEGDPKIPNSTVKNRYGNPDWIMFCNHARVITGKNYIDSQGRNTPLYLSDGLPKIKIETIDGFDYNVAETKSTKYMFMVFRPAFIGVLKRNGFT